MILMIYSLLCFFIPNTVWIFVNRRHLKGKTHSIRHIVWCYVFMYYCYLAVQDAAGIGTVWNLIRYGKLDGTINAIPFSSEGIFTYALNVVMFVPLGFLLPLIWENFRKIWKVVLVGFCMSLMIELCQLFCSRVTDIDDLLMNTFGTVLGYCCWVIFKKIFSKAGSKSIMISVFEPVIYIVLGMGGIFLLYNWSWLQ